MGALVTFIVETIFQLRLCLSGWEIKLVLFSWNSVSKMTVVSNSVSYLSKSMANSLSNPAGNFAPRWVYQAILVEMTDKTLYGLRATRRQKEMRDFQWSAHGQLNPISGSSAPVRCTYPCHPALDISYIICWYLHCKRRCEPADMIIFTLSANYIDFQHLELSQYWATLGHMQLNGGHIVQFHLFEEIIVSVS